ncbi:hypothetical protein GIB67_038141 [Kingdonia uniflora]|uniref:Uncharacterized protein n=1 Tax=Kingdonia uniflora TaxID=39325 RepID=A0A7J7M1Z2_9MAGN|nr:hypothetical protein GIB67_038141 [Kingdonia uniflora]
MPSSAPRGVDFILQCKFSFKILQKQDQPQTSGNPIITAFNTSTRLITTQDTPTLKAEFCDSLTCIPRHIIWSGAEIPYHNGCDNFEQTDGQAYLDSLKYCKC